MYRVIEGLVSCKKGDFMGFHAFWAEAISDESRFGGFWGQVGWRALYGSCGRGFEDSIFLGWGLDCSGGKYLKP